MILAVSGLVLVHGDIENPMQAVFDAPMAACDLAEAIGGERRTEQVVSGLGGDSGADLTAAPDFANGCQAGPIMVLL